MSRPPQRFFAQMTKAVLAEMLAPTYAEISGIDANEAYRRLEPSLKDVDLISAVQFAMWDAIVASRSEDEAKILDLITKKQSKSRKWRVPKGLEGKEQGAWTAMGLYLDLFAGVASGEAADLLETDSGQALLARGFDLLGAHLAAELLR